MRALFRWQLRSRTLALGKRTVVMGVVNVTPDSFYDGGRYFSAENAAQHALKLLEEGADILDIGGESTRPGASTSKNNVSEQEELRRVLPVIEAVKAARPDAVISVDTYKSAVARAAAKAGAEIVNDVSACRWDSHMSATIAEVGMGVVLMHMRGRPEDWRKLPMLPADSLLAQVRADLAAWAGAAMAAGIGQERIVLDPGFGFGKNFEENYPLLARFDELHRLGFPLLSGTSRKSFVGRALRHHGHDAVAEARLYGSLATVAISILQGAHVVRVHDVKEAVDTARVADAILDAHAVAAAS